MLRTQTTPVFLFCATRSHFPPLFGSTEIFFYDDRPKAGWRNRPLSVGLKLRTILKSLISVSQFEPLGPLCPFDFGFFNTPRFLPASHLVYFYGDKLVLFPRRVALPLPPAEPLTRGHRGSLDSPVLVQCLVVHCPKLWGESAMILL